MSIWLYNQIWNLLFRFKGKCELCRGIKKIPCYGMNIMGGEKFVGYILCPNCKE